VAHYSTRLRLEFDPFEPRAAARGFFTGAGRGEVLDELLVGAITGGLLACVSGDSGSGKTTLAQEFCRRCGEEAECVRIEATLFMNRAGFLDCLAAELDWLDAGRDWPQCLNAIARRAADLDLEARALVVIIDDAHELSGEVVAALAQILRRCEGGFSLLLLGEDQLPVLLRQSLPAALGERVSHFELAPLSSEDSFDYVRFKLATAGYTHTLPLSGDRLGALYRQSGGIPARLNALIAAALGDQEVAATATAPAPATPSLFSPARPYWLAAGGLAIVLLGVLLLGDGGENAPPAPTRSIPVAVNAGGAADNASAPRTSAPAPVPVETPTSDSARAPVAVDASTQEQVVAKAAGEEPAAIPVATAQPEPATTPGIAALPAFTRALLDAGPNGFTIQVMGTRSEDNARRFFTDDESGVIETRFQNRPWYVVVHGRFRDRDAASAAIAGLPPAVRELQPFIRSLADIQATLRQQLSSR